MKRCYYDILEVDRKAPESAIKQAYRKVVIKCHPDKNPTEQGKKMFLEVQEAYDILSDPNERTFYDNNREKILFDKDSMSKEDLEQYSFGFNIWEFFTARCFKGLGDQEGGFFTVYRTVFEKIKGQQGKAFALRDDLEESVRKYEGFGTLTTNLDKVLKFYDDWENFTSYKTFSWSQEYDLREAENRWVKRRMQQENKKQRLKEKRNYIKTIKDLVSFVKKRDVRFQQHLIQLKEEEDRKEKEKIKKLEEKNNGVINRKKLKQTLQQERFRQIDEYYKQNNAPEEKQHGIDQIVQPDFYCPICDKLFKSDNQLMNHERSKIHKQAVKLIQKQVMLPGQRLQGALNQDGQTTENTPTGPAKKKRFRKKKNQATDQPENQQGEKVQGTEGKSQAVKQKTKQEPEAEQEGAQKKKKNKKPKKQTSEESQAEEDILISLARNRTKKADQVVHPEEAKNGKGKPQPKKKTAKKGNRLFSSESEKEDGEEEKAIGKAKLKKAKKAELQKDLELKCKTCAFTFPSRTKLFEHLEESKHAAYKS